MGPQGQNRDLKRNVAKSTSRRRFARAARAGPCGASGSGVYTGRRDVAPEQGYRTGVRAAATPAVAPSVRLFGIDSRPALVRTKKSGLGRAWRPRACSAAKIAPLNRDRGLSPCRWRAWIFPATALRQHGSARFRCKTRFRRLTLLRQKGKYGADEVPGGPRGCIATKILSYLPFTLISVREMAARGLIVDTC
jgi:hypothetical protein